MKHPGAFNTVIIKKHDLAGGLKITPAVANFCNFIIMDFNSKSNNVRYFCGLGF